MTFRGVCGRYYFRVRARFLLIIYNQWSRHQFVVGFTIGNWIVSDDKILFPIFSLAFHTRKTRTYTHVLVYVCKQHALSSFLCDFLLREWWTDCFPSWTSSSSSAVGSASLCRIEFRFFFSCVFPIQHIKCDAGEARELGQFGFYIYFISCVKCIIYWKRRQSRISNLNCIRKPSTMCRATRSLLFYAHTEYARMPYMHITIKFIQDRKIS